MRVCCCHHSWTLLGAETCTCGASAKALAWLTSPVKCTLFIYTHIFYYLFIFNSARPTPTDSTNSEKIWKADCGGGAGLTVTVREENFVQTASNHGQWWQWCAGQPQEHIQSKAHSAKMHHRAPQKLFSCWWQSKSITLPSEQQSVEWLTLGLLICFIVNN